MSETVTTVVAGVLKSRSERFYTTREKQQVKRYDTITGKPSWVETETESLVIGNLVFPRPEWDKKAEGFGQQVPLPGELEVFCLDSFFRNRNWDSHFLAVGMVILKASNYRRMPVESHITAADLVEKLQQVEKALLALGIEEKPELLSLLGGG